MGFAVTGLEGCIRHWESTKKESRHLLSEATLFLIEETIQYLRELQKLQRGTK